MTGDAGKRRLKDPFSHRGAATKACAAFLIDTRGQTHYGFIEKKQGLVTHFSPPYSKEIASFPLPLRILHQERDFGIQKK